MNKSTQFPDVDIPDISKPIIDKPLFIPTEPRPPANYCYYQPRPIIEYPPPMQAYFKTIEKKN